MVVWILQPTSTTEKVTFDEYRSLVWVGCLFKCFPHFDLPEVARGLVPEVSVQTVEEVERYE